MPRAEGFRGRRGSASAREAKRQGNSCLSVKDGVCREVKGNGMMMR